MLPANKKVRRIHEELKDVGATSYGLAKFASRFLPNILHDDEHIGGAVYGRYAAGTGLLRWSEGMLVATERRVIFLDRKPGFESMDELTYDVVSGVQKSYAWPFSAVTLHTRIGNYTVRFANSRCIDVFIAFVEGRRLESANSKRPQSPTKAHAVIDKTTLAFLMRHDLAVLSTVDRDNKAHGAAVHYTLVNDEALYILTKAETQKAHNMLAHHQVAITIYDQSTLQTLQLQGDAELEPEQAMKDRIFKLMIRPRVYGDHIDPPPVTALSDGAFEIFRITPTSLRFTDFRQEAR